jgi:adenosylcobinamide kinase/adenosylcobinamide-phosphate guanylyltransferase
MPEPRQGRLILVLGGARSGKSRYAQQLAEHYWLHPIFLATAEATDAEMVARIAKHRAARGARWTCVEEPLDLAGGLARAAGRGDGVLLDCLTVWLGNVLHNEGTTGVAARQQALLAALHKKSGDVILVSNEVGLGIVPEHPLGREFRDLAGWLNQAIAAEADAVLFIAAGLPLALKGAAYF